MQMVYGGDAKLFRNKSIKTYLKVTELHSCKNEPLNYMTFLFLILLKSFFKGQKSPVLNILPIVSVFVKLSVHII